MRASSPAGRKRRHFSVEPQEISYIASRPIISGSGHGSFRLGLRSRPRDADEFASDILRSAPRASLLLIGARFGAVIGSSIFMRHGTNGRAKDGSLLCRRFLYGALRPVRPVAVLWDLACITDLCWRQTRSGRLPRNDLADAHAEKFRGRVMGVFQQQPWPPPARPNGIRTYRAA